MWPQCGYKRDTNVLQVCYASWTAPQQDLTIVYMGGIRLTPASPVKVRNAMKRLLTLLLTCILLFSMTAQASEKEDQAPRRRSAENRTGKIVHQEEREDGEVPRAPRTKKQLAWKAGLPPAPC